jgi:uncharacterized delta-60 repeat protein
MVRISPSRLVRTAAIRLAGVLACLVLARTGMAADGDLDPTFGTGGRVVTGFDLPAAGARGIAMQPDGKIVAAGWLFNLTGAYGFAVARYMPDGSLDTTFGTNGKVRTTFFGANDFATEAVIQPDGKILVAGRVERNLQIHFAVVRYFSNGSLDPTFGDGGKVIGTFFGVLEAMLLQPDGRIVLAGGGFFEGNNGDIAISRYNPDGSPDSTFGLGGTTHTDIAGLGEGAVAIFLLPQGKLLALGSTGSNVTVSDMVLVRYNSDGTLDHSFANGGKKILDVAGRADDVSDAVRQPDGNIIVSGSFDPAGFGGDLSVVRILADGEVDFGFGDGGIATVGLPESDEAAYGVALQADGKIVAAGIASAPNNYYDFALARFHANGAPDATFGPLGARTVTDFYQRGDGALAVLVQPDGKIVLAGGANDGNTGFMALTRYVGRPASTSTTCPRSYGYWRTHPEKWPISLLTLGSQSYGSAELVALLHHPAKGDASVLLARELIAAKLNLATGSGSEGLSGVVAVADGLLSRYPGRLPYEVSPSSQAGREMVRVAGSLASTTNRGARPGCGEVKDPK